MKRYFSFKRSDGVDCTFVHCHNHNNYKTDKLLCHRRIFLKLRDLSIQLADKLLCCGQKFVLDDMALNKVLAIDDTVTYN